MMNEPVRVGIIGLGMAGRDHLGRVAACDAATAVCAADPDAHARTNAESAAPGIRCYDDYKAMLEREEVDLVIVATPHHLHAGMVVDALSAGRHVLCEKPLAITTQECDRMIAAAHAAGRRLFVGHNQRLSPVFAGLKHVLAENDMGPLIGGIVQYLGYEGTRMADPSSWKGSYDRAGGGVLLDGGCHAVDLCNWYFGRAVAVTARCRRPAGCPAGKAETTAQALTEYEGNVTAQVTATFEARLPGSFTQGVLQMKADLLYEQGWARADYAYLGAAGSNRSVAYACRSDELHEVDLAKRAGIGFAEHAVDCLISGREPVATAEDGRRAVAVIEAAYASAREGRRVAIPA